MGMLQLKRKMVKDKEFNHTTRRKTPRVVETGVRESRKRWSACLEATVWLAGDAEWDGG